MSTSIGKLLVAQVRPPVDDAVTALEKYPLSVDLGNDLRRLEREEQTAIDRRRQEELARLRKIQSFD